MRESVISQRAGRHRASGAKGRAAEVAVQRPAPRRSRPLASEGGRSAKSFAWKRALRFVPLFAKLLLAITLGVLAFVGYRTAASASFFQVKTIDVEGATNASRDEIKEVAASIAGRTGVWRADLKVIGQEIERLAWVRSAVVSRVLPSGVRIRIAERSPAIIARTAGGRLVWVDDEGVMLGAASPGEEDFFVRGLDESRSTAALEQNRDRVRVATELARGWKASGLSSRVSEINLDDLRDVRVQLAGADAHVEVRLGREDYVKRFRQALEVLDAQRGTTRGPFVTYVDVSQGKRAIVGTGANAQFPPQALTVEGGNVQVEPASDGRDGSQPQTPASDSSATRKNKRPGAGRSDRGRERNSTSAPADSAGRPRRVG